MVPRSYRMCRCRCSVCLTILPSNHVRFLHACKTPSHMPYFHSSSPTSCLSASLTCQTFVALHTLFHPGGPLCRVCSFVSGWVCFLTNQERAYLCQGHAKNDDYCQKHVVFLSRTSLVGSHDVCAGLRHCSTFLGPSPNCLFHVSFFHVSYFVFWASSKSCHVSSRLIAARARPPDVTSFNWALCPSHVIFPFPSCINLFDSFTLLACVKHGLPTALRKNASLS
jgi:hypothetical protein